MPEPRVCAYCGLPESAFPVGPFDIVDVDEWGREPLRSFIAHQDACVDAE